jgi:hypothetical protein
MRSQLIGPEPRSIPKGGFVHRLSSVRADERAAVEREAQRLAALEARRLTELVRHNQIRDKWLAQWKVGQIWQSHEIEWYDMATRVVTHNEWRVDSIDDGRTYGRPCARVSSDHGHPREEVGRIVENVYFDSGYPARRYFIHLYLQIDLIQCLYSP